MNSDDTRHIQTEPSGGEYGRFRELDGERRPSAEVAEPDTPVARVGGPQRTDPTDRISTDLDGDEWDVSDVASTLGDAPQAQH